MLAKALYSFSYAMCVCKWKNANKQSKIETKENKKRDIFSSCFDIIYEEGLPFTVDFIHLITRRTIVGDILKNISPVTVPSVFYSSLIFSLINAFFAIYTSKAETTFSSKKTFASSSSAWNAHRLHLDTFKMKY